MDTLTGSRFAGYRTGKLRSRSRWTAATVRHRTGRSLRAASTVKQYRDVMLGDGEPSFGNELPASPVEWLTDNGSRYRAIETRQFARMLGLNRKARRVRIRSNDGSRELRETIKRDYISVMPKPERVSGSEPNCRRGVRHYITGNGITHGGTGLSPLAGHIHRRQASNGLAMVSAEV